MLALRRAALARALTAPHRAAALRVAPLLRASLRTSAALSARKPAPPAAAPEPEADDDEEPTADVTNPKVLKEIMDKHVEYCRRELSKLRGAQASPNMLDHVMVEAYGDKQPLPGVAQIALKNPNLIAVSPFDAALANAVANAIRDAGLNLNPAVEGNVVRVPIPKASKETKDATLKLITKISDNAKNRVRKVRQTALDKLKKLEGVSADDVFRDMKEVQAVATTATDAITKLVDKKKAEVTA